MMQHHQQAPSKDQIVGWVQLHICPVEDLTIQAVTNREEAR